MTKTKDMIHLVPFDELSKKKQRGIVEELGPPMTDEGVIRAYYNRRALGCGYRWHEFSPKGFQRCTAYKKNKRERKGLQCRYWSIPSKDKCKFHGGLNPIKHGMYSRYKQGTLAEKAEEFAAEPGIKSLREEVGILRAMLNRQLENEDDSGIVGLVDTIRKTVTALVQIEEGLKLTLDITQVQAMIKQVTVVIQEEVADAESVSKIADRLRRLDVLPRPMAAEVVGAET